MSGLLESYNHSVNGRYTQARDLILKYHIPDLGISDAKITAAYNRALVQLGFCSFQKGDYESCKQSLDEICSTFRLKELLCQSIPKAAVDREDKTNILPYHLHISIEKIETIFMLCLLLIEVPYLLSGDLDGQKKQVNKFFLRLWQYYEKNILYGEPENYRDFIYQAIHEMAKGDWQSCYDSVTKLDLWKKLPNSEAILADLELKIKEQAFKCFIFSMSRSLHTLKFDQLAALFNLEMPQIQKIIFEVIHKKQLSARLDSSSNSIVFVNQISNDLESAGVELSQKLSCTVSVNEKIFDFKFGGADANDLSKLQDSLLNRKNQSSRKPKLLSF